MPIYEYQCRDCGEQFEFLLRGEEKPSCPACESEQLDKLISVPAAPQMADRAGGHCAAPRGDRPPCDSDGCCPGCSCPMGH